jgi:hypothetical protein
MKTKLFGLLLCMLSLISVTFASQNDFYINQSEIDQEFTELNHLEKIVIDNNYCTLSELSQSNYAIAKELRSKLNLESPFEPPLGIPSFFWGCCLGPIGIALAYVFADEDKSEAKKALTGCIVGYGSIIVFYVVVWVWLLSNPAVYY